MTRATRAHKEHALSTRPAHARHHHVIRLHADTASSVGARAKLLPGSVKRGWDFALNNYPQHEHEEMGLRLRLHSCA